MIQRVQGRLPGIHQGARLEQIGSSLRSVVRIGQDVRDALRRAARAQVAVPEDRPPDSSRLTRIEAARAVVDALKQSRFLEGLDRLKINLARPQRTAKLLDASGLEEPRDGLPL